MVINDILHVDPLFEENSQRVQDSNSDASANKSHEGDQTRPTTVHAEIHARQNTTQKSQMRISHDFQEFDCLIFRYLFIPKKVK